jgi:hypothetical protein
MNLPAPFRVTASDSKTVHYFFIGFPFWSFRITLLCVPLRIVKLQWNIVFLICLSGLLACSKKKVPDADTVLGLDYYPTTIGKYIVYQVDSTVYTDLPRDTLVYSFQLREKITEQFEESNGSSAYRLERSVRYADATKSYEKQPWRLHDVWLIRAGNKNIEVQENNLRFIRLIFPVQLNASWDCNKTNTLTEQFCRYAVINEPIVINQLNLENTLTVNQLNNINLIEAQTATEMYAKGVGLISKDYARIEGKKVEAGKTVFERIEKGLIYKQRLLSHGVE